VRSFFIHRLAPWLVVASFIALVAAKFDRESGFLPLLRFGEHWQERQLPAVRTVAPPVVPDSAGYDGQFYAQVALDPLLRDPALAAALDAPAYRARRILVPAAAHVLGLGQPAWVLQIFALLNVGCWCAFAFLLWREIQPNNAIGFARWVACTCSLGVLDSVRQSLVDLPAALLLLVAVRAHRAAPDPTAATLWSALGHLAKETNLIASAALFLGRRLRLRTFSLGAISAVPIVLWWAYAGHRFPGGESGTGNFTWPLLGAASQFAHSLREFTSSGPTSRQAFTILAIPALFLQAIVVLRQAAFDNPWWRIGVAYGVLLLFLGPWVWSGYWAACRAVLPLTLAFNLLLPAHRAFWPLWIVGNVTILHGVWRFL
jgi:hypothetical protein